MILRRSAAGIVRCTGRRRVRGLHQKPGADLRRLLEEDGAGATGMSGTCPCRNRRTRLPLVAPTPPRAERGTYGRPTPEPTPRPSTGAPTTPTAAPTLISLRTGGTCPKPCCAEQEEDCLWTRACWACASRYWRSSSGRGRRAAAPAMPGALRGKRAPARTATSTRRCREQAPPTHSLFELAAAPSSAAYVSRPLLLNLLLAAECWARLLPASLRPRPVSAHLLDDLDLI